MSTIATEFKQGLWVTQPRSPNPFTKWFIRSEVITGKTTGDYVYISRTHKGISTIGYLDDLELTDPPESKRAKFNLRLNKQEASSLLEEIKFLNVYPNIFEEQMRNLLSKLEDFVDND